MNTLTTAARRTSLWLCFARCYQKEAGRGRPDYWLARAGRAELEATHS